MKKIFKLITSIIVVVFFYNNTASAQTFTAGNIAVFVAAASASNTTGSVLELNPSVSGPAINTYNIDGTTLPNSMRFSGSATSTAYVANSNDGTLFAFTGVNDIVTGPNVNTILPRAVGTLNNSFAFNLATTYTGISGNQARSATSIDNTTWFIGDQGGLYSNGTSTPNPPAASPGANIRGIKSFGGIVYSAAASGTAASIQVNTVSAAIGGPITGLPGLTNNSSLQDFYLISSGVNGFQFDVLYIISATSNTVGAITKYSLVSGTWVANGSYATTFGGFGLAAERNAGGANLYVSTGLGALTANSVIKLNDLTGYNVPININTPSNQILFTTGAGTIIKGVAFAPATPLVVSPVSQTTISCHGGNDGAASVIASGGTGVLSYNWAPGNPTGNGTPAITGLTAGTYTCTVSDAHTILTTQTFNITEPSTLVVSPVSQTNIACNGGNSGAASVSVSGGTTGYSYDWTPGTPAGDGTNSVTGLSFFAGGYTCTVTDANSCTNTATFNITQPSALTSSVVSQTNVSCNGGSNGAATISASNGTPGYTYSWAPAPGTGQGTVSVTGLTGQPYTCTITDANGCTQVQGVTITQPSAITVSVSSSSNVSCHGNNDGSATATASGGTGALSYSWTPSGGNAATAPSLIAGSYTCTVMDANSCTSSASVSITEPASNLTVTQTQTNVSCNGGTNGTANLAVSGGNPFGSSSKGLLISEFLGNPLGTDSAKEYVELIATKHIDFSVTPYSVIWANNGTATANGWITGGNITYGFNISSGIVNAGDVVYVGGTMMGSNGGPTMNILRAISTYNTPGDNGLGNANVSGVMGNGGSNADAIGVFNLPLVSLSNSTVPMDALFFGTSIGNALVSGGTAGYELPVNDLYSGGKLQSTSFFGPDPGSGIYISATGSYNVQTDLFPATRVWNTSTSPTNNVSNVSLIGLYNYSWSNSSTTQNLSGLAAGTYSFAITDNSTCPFTGSVVITEPAVLSAAIAAQTNISCNGANNGNLTITPSGGTSAYNYSWLPSGGTAATASGLSSGAYTCTIIDANGCTTSASATITEPAILAATISSQTDNLCNGGNNGGAIVNVTGGTSTYNYSWTPTGGNAATASGLSAGTYTCNVTDFNGCTTSVSVTITEPSVLSASVSAHTDISCNGANNGSLTVTASGGTSGYSYSWSPSGGNTATASGLSSGAYTCNISDGNGCTTSASSTITQPSILAVTIPSHTNNLCNGGNSGSATSTVTGGTSGYTYLWSPSGQTTLFASSLTAGAYTCDVTDANGCTASATVSITEPSPVTGIVSAINTTCGNDNGTATVTASGGNGSYSYTWSPSGGSAATASNLAAGVYTVAISDALGCPGSASASITGSSAPAPVSLGNDTTVCSPFTVNFCAPGGFSTYLWNDGSTTACITAGTSGCYDITATDANGCIVRDTVCLTVNICTGISDLTSSGFNLYPNPNDGHFTITSESSKVEMLMELFDAQGQLLQQKIIQANSTLDFSQYAKGFYFIRIDGQTQKLVIQ